MKAYTDDAQLQVCMCVGMHSIPTHTAWQDYACGALATLAQGSSSAMKPVEIQAVLAAGVSDALYNAMTAHPSSYAIHAGVGTRVR